MRIIDSTTRPLLGCYFDTELFVDIKVSDKKYMPIETHTFSTHYFESGDAFIEEIKKTGIEL